MPRARRSYGYLISCRLGDAMAPHVVMTWAMAYAGRDGGGRKLAQTRLVQADAHNCNIHDLAGKLKAHHDAIEDGLGTKWDHYNREKPEQYGLSCVVDQSRNSAFRKVLKDHRFDPELTQTLNNDRLDDWSPNLLDTLVGRSYLINDLSSELAARRVRLEPKGTIPVSDIAEALEGAQRRAMAREHDTTVVVETDYRDDLALCTALGVFWAHYRPPASESWLTFEAEAGGDLVPYIGAII